MWIYLQDRFVSKEQANISIFDHGLLYGDGLFETLRSYSGKIFRLSQHLDRLSRSANRLALSLPPASTLEKLLYETLARNLLDDAILRLTITRGEGELGLDPDLCPKPTLFIIARAFTAHPPEQYAKGVSGAVVQIRRNATATLDPALKSISFLNNILAKQEAKRRGAFEGIFLNLEGYIAEGTISNLFWVREGRLKTPSLEVGILDGITREAVLELSKENDMRVEEGFYRIEDLLEADEAFLTNSSFELMPLIQVDGEKIGNGRPGPITRQLHQAFNEAVRQR